jgi:hypothetical protein
LPLTLTFRPTVGLPAIGALLASDAQRDSCVPLRQSTGVHGTTENVPDQPDQPDQSGAHVSDPEYSGE